MSINLVSVKCPECGATLSLEENMQQAFCSYCGARVLVNNDNEYIFKHIDEAEIRRAETDRIIKLKKLEIAEQKSAREQKNKRTILLITLISAVIGIITLLVGMVTKHEYSGVLLIIGLLILCGALLFGILSLGRYKHISQNEEKKRRVIQIVISNVFTFLALLIIVIGIIESRDWSSNSNFIMSMGGILLIVSSILSGRENEGIASPLGAIIASCIIIVITKNASFIDSFGYDVGDVSNMLGFLGWVALIISVINLVRNGKRIYKP